MQIAVIHGYFLHDSGSAIYTRELAREFVRQGHDVTLVCQEQNPEDYDFIDHVYDMDSNNCRFYEPQAREKRYAGSCRLVRPNIGGELLTYVAGPFPGFSARAFQDATSEQIDAYVNFNITALQAVFARWKPDFVQANHIVMQPYVALEALRKTKCEDIPVAITVHGSELNFTINRDPRMEPYAIAALEGAATVYALSDTSMEEVALFAQRQGVVLGGRLQELPPGVDTDLFRPRADRQAVLASVSPRLDPVLDDIAVFAGRLLWTKGLHYIVAALPLALVARPRLQLIVAGDGPMRCPLGEFIAALDQGDLERAETLLADEPDLRQEPDYGDVLPRLDRDAQQEYIRSARGLAQRIHFLGHVDHLRLSEVLAAADLSLAPSVFPEAFGLVSIEALSAGAIPLATYQSGLRTPIDALADVLEDESVKSLGKNQPLTMGLAREIKRVLQDFPTKEGAFRKRLHETAVQRFSWSAVASNMISAVGG